MSETTRKNSKFLSKTNHSAIMRLEYRQKIVKSKATRRNVDWQQVHQRIESTKVMAETQLDTEAILQQRANALSLPIAVSQPDTTNNTVVTLKYSSCQLALNVEYVREIIELEEVTPVPGVPAFIAGVVNWRGKILTLVNLENFLGFKAASGAIESSEKLSVVLVESHDFEFGLLCNGFPAIGRSSEGQFGPIDWDILDNHPDCLSGVSKEGVLMLNLAALTTDPAFLVNQE